MNVEHTAVHEAGHAIAACELEMIYAYCSIEANEQRGTLGNVAVAEDEPHPSAPDATFTAWSESHAVVDYAGHAALVVLLGIGEMSGQSAQQHGADQDFEQASERLNGDAAAIERCKRRAMQIVTERVADVRKLSTVLLERRRLSAQQIDWLLYREEPIPEWLE
jgi:hypothetical protein